MDPQPYFLQIWTWNLGGDIVFVMGTLATAWVGLKVYERPAWAAPFAQRLAVAAALAAGTFLTYTLAMPLSLPGQQLEFLSFAFVLHERTMLDADGYARTAIVWGWLGILFVASYGTAVVEAWATNRSALRRASDGQGRRSRP